MSYVIVPLILASMLTKTFWKAAFWCFIRLFHLLKMGLICLIPLAFMSSPQFLVRFGWTPISLMFGKDIYNGMVLHNKQIYIVDGEIKLVNH